MNDEILHSEKKRHKQKKWQNQKRILLILQAYQYIQN